MNYTTAIANVRKLIGERTTAAYMDDEVADLLSESGNLLEIIMSNTKLHTLIKIGTIPLAGGSFSLPDDFSIPLTASKAGRSYAFVSAKNYYNQRYRAPANPWISFFGGKAFVANHTSAGTADSLFYIRVQTHYIPVKLPAGRAVKTYETVTGTDEVSFVDELEDVMIRLAAGLAFLSVKAQVDPQFAQQWIEEQINRVSKISEQLVLTKI